MAQKSVTEYLKKNLHKNVEKWQFFITFHGFFNDISKAQQTWIVLTMIISYRDQFHEKINQFPSKNWILAHEMFAGLWTLEIWSSSDDFFYIKKANCINHSWVHESKVSVLLLNQWKITWHHLLRSLRLWINVKVVV